MLIQVVSLLDAYAADFFQVGCPEILRKVLHMISGICFNGDVESPLEHKLFDCFCLEPDCCTKMMSVYTVYAEPQTKCRVNSVADQANINAIDGSGLCINTSISGSFERVSYFRFGCSRPACLDVCDGIPDERVEGWYLSSACSDVGDVGHSDVVRTARKDTAKGALVEIFQSLETIVHTSMLYTQPPQRDLRTVVAIYRLRLYSPWLVVEANTLLQTSRACNDCLDGHRLGGFHTLWTRPDTSHAMRKEGNFARGWMRGAAAAISHFAPLLDAQQRHHARSRYTKCRLIRSSIRVPISKFAAGDQVTCSAALSLMHWADFLSGRLTRLMRIIVSYMVS